MGKSRIEYVDFSKGICIVLVVWYHVCLLYRHEDSILDIQGSFRMPLYFILSGLFFKPYNSWMEFLKKKTNKLLVPYFFFYVVLSFLLPVVMIVVDGLGGGNFSTLNIKHLLGLAFGWLREGGYNDAIWFLMALFFTNVLFYMISAISNKNKHAIVYIILLSVVTGFVGCLLAKIGVNIKFFYLDTALTAVPFYAFGYLLRRHTHFLNQINWKNDLLMALLLSFLFVIPFNIGTISAMKINAIYYNPFIFYLCGISGTIVMLCFSKLIRQLNLINYIGRYSIMILVTHWAIIKVFRKYIGYMSENEMLNLICVFLVIMAICTSLIPLMKKYVPKYTAQKDLFI